MLASLVACGDDGSFASSGDGPSGDTTGSGQTTGSGAPTGPGDGNFRTAFAEDSFGTTCEASLADLKTMGAPMVEVGSTAIVVGFQQYGDNQDPVFVRFDDGEKVYCEHHEKEPPDGRAYGVTWDGGPTAYVIYSVVGGGTAFDDHAKGGWVDRYGDGGGSSKVTVLATVETQFGTVQRATFVPAKRQMGTKTNTLAPAGPIKVLTNGDLEVLGKSAFAPLNPDKSVMCVPDSEYPSAFDGGEGPNYLARFSVDLAELKCASTAGCSLVTTPCAEAL